MNTTITSDNATVLDTGTVFSFNDQPIIFTLTNIEKPTDRFTLKFSFAYDADNPSSRCCIGKDNSPLCHHVELINFRDPLGTGTLVPTRFAVNTNGTAYYIVFMVSSWEEKLSKKFSYTIYRVEKSKDQTEGKGNE
ncbi:MAG: hypothetical protein J6Y19_10135 [Kiritimatiellae bacterium]|nr:hypothetical protein [Kiritimatiellia bacterium]